MCGFPATDGCAAALSNYFLMRMFSWARVWPVTLRRQPGTLDLQARGVCGYTNTARSRLRSSEPCCSSCFVPILLAATASPISRFVQLGVVTLRDKFVTLCRARLPVMMLERIHPCLFARNARVWGNATCHAKMRCAASGRVGTKELKGQSGNCHSNSDKRNTTKTHCRNCGSRACGRAW